MKLLLALLFALLATWVSADPLEAVENVKEDEMIKEDKPVEVALNNDPDDDGKNDDSGDDSGDEDDVQNDDNDSGDDSGGEDDVQNDDNDSGDDSGGEDDVQNDDNDSGDDSGDEDDVQNDDNDDGKVRVLSLRMNSGSASLDAKGLPLICLAGLAGLLTLFRS